MVEERRTLDGGEVAVGSKSPVGARVGARSMSAETDEGATGGARQAHLSWFQMMVWRPKTSPAMARTRLSQSPKGGRWFPDKKDQHRLTRRPRTA